MASFESHHSCACALLAGLSFWPRSQTRSAGWFVMDDLDISGRLGGAVSLTSGYARNPLVITGPDGKQKLVVVLQEAFVDFGWGT